MRQEFSAKTKVQAYERSKGRCEACGARLQVGHTRYDHLLPDGLGGLPNLENCRVVCTTCDAPKTAADQRQIAKATRQHRKHIGAVKKRWISKWKKMPDGRVVLREPK